MRPVSSTRTDSRQVGRKLKMTAVPLGAGAQVMNTSMRVVRHG